MCQPCDIILVEWDFRILNGFNHPTQPETSLTSLPPPLSSGLSPSLLGFPKERLLEMSDWSPRSCCKGLAPPLEVSTSGSPPADKGHQKEINAGQEHLQGRAFQVPLLGTAPADTKSKNPKSLWKESERPWKHRSPLETHVERGTDLGLV